jgi:hypothetical protein
MAEPPPALLPLARAMDDPTSARAHIDAFVVAQTLRYMPFNININVIINASGEVIEFQVSVNHAGITILHIKHMVEAATGIPPEEQTLVLDGVTLLDGYTIGHYGIFDGTTLYLIDASSPPPSPHAGPAPESPIAPAAPRRGARHATFVGPPQGRTLVWD